MRLSFQQSGPIVAALLVGVASGLGALAIGREASLASDNIGARFRELGGGA